MILLTPGNSTSESQELSTNSYNHQAAATASSYLDPIHEAFESLLNAKEILNPPQASLHVEGISDKSLDVALQKLSQPTMPMPESLAVASLSLEPCNQ